MSHAQHESYLSSRDLNYAETFLSAFLLRQINFIQMKQIKFALLWSKFWLCKLLLHFEIKFVEKINFPPRSISEKTVFSFEKKTFLPHLIVVPSLFVYELIIDDSSIIFPSLHKNNLLEISCFSHAQISNCFTIRRKYLFIQKKTSAD